MALLGAACDTGGGDASPSTAAPTHTRAAATATPTPRPRPLAAQIGVRGSIPEADPIALAARYGKTDGRAPASKPFAGARNIGDSRPFFVTRLTPAAIAQTAPPEIVQVDARLMAKSAHAYFYVESTLDVAAGDVERSAAAFDATTWPAVTSVFGEPAIPGVDGDPRIVVLYARLGGVGGYHSGDDLYLRAVRPRSNEAEMAYLDATLGIGSGGFDVVLAHELQHLVHSRNDAGEEAWVNEGLSESARFLAGGVASTVAAFEAAPGTQLDAWDSSSSRPHYGASAAFVEYLAGRFGGDVLGAVARAPEDGAVGIESALRPFDASISFHTVFADWAAANWLNRAGGPFGTPRLPMTMASVGVLTPGEAVSGEATQFGTAYYDVPAQSGEQQVLFQGARDVPALPVEPPQGAMLWSNAGDAIDSMVTRELDLTGVDTPVLTFRAWYDIEPWYDWAYVAVSADGGTTWEALAGEHTRADDPIGVALGRGYGGKSGGGASPAWVDERIDLAQYSGKKVLLRFEYVTDGATHGGGMALDDVRVEGTDLAGGPPDASWRLDGWVRLDRDLSQEWVVRVLATRPNGEAVVFDVPVDATGAGALRFNADGLQDVGVMVAGATEGTVQRAPYTLLLARP